MSIVVGVAPGHPSSAAVHLGVLLARSYEQPLVLAAVPSAGWPLDRTLGGVDSEYREFVLREAEEALAEAGALVPEDIRVASLVHGAASARRGLLEVCDAHDALRLVVGAKGETSDGETRLGSVVTGLLQSSGIPVAIAPHGFTAAAGSRLTRVTAAYSGSLISGELVLGAAAIAAESRCAVRIASFHTQPRAFAAAGVGFDAEDPVVKEWERVIRDYAAALLDDIERFTVQPTSATLEVGAGSDWHTALRAIAWDPAEVLLVGSSSLGPLARVSLGSHAVKIVRHSPVPVVIVPRRATDDYIAQADELIA